MSRCGRRLPLVGLLVLVLGSAAYAFAPDSDTSLVGWWKLDDGSGTTALDSSSGKHNGTLTNGPVWTNGHYGGAIQFDGVDDYVDTGWNDNLATWTIACWVTSSAAPSSSGAPSGPLHREGNYQINWNHNGGWAGYLGANIGGSWMGTTFGTLEANTWYHLCGTFDGANMTAYTNGVQASTLSASGTPSAESSTLKLGRHAANTQYFGGLVDDARVYNRALILSEIKLVMMSSGEGPATNPSPRDKDTDVVREVNLSWTPGPLAGTHNVYLGTNFDDVNSATTSSPLLVSPGQTASTYDPPGRLDFGTTYYWRVDEVNATADQYVFKGTTWQFATEPYAYKMTGITATASSVSSATNTPAINMVNDSDMTDDLAGVNNKAMWQSAKGQFPFWAQFDFDGLYKLHGMKVWNHNTSYESVLGFGAKDTVVEYSLDGATWTKLGDFQFAQATGEENQAANVIVAFNGVVAKSVKITINNAWRRADQTGMSEVRFYYLPVIAREPSPAPGSTGIDPTTLALSWRAGREAASHNVYLGTDANAVKADTVPTGTVAAASYTPSGLQLSATYYWKIEEVNTAEIPSNWTGGVWNFATADFLSVDDMESYNDGTNPVFDVWIDGYNTSDNGAVVGHNSPANNTFNETAIVHGGKQSMPFTYGDRNITTSEIARTYTPAQDWSVAGIKTLTVFFHGATANTAGQFYVKVNDAKITYPGDASILSALVWKQWNIDLSAVGNVKAVQTLTLGVTGSGKGTLYIDDIRLYNTAPIVPAPVDPGTSNLVASYAMEGDAKDSKGGYDGTLNTVTFADSMLTTMGKAAVFNGTSGYIDLGTTFGTGVVSKLTNCTAAAWVYYTGTGAVWQRVLDLGTGSTVYMFLTTRNASSFPRFAITTAGSGSESGVTSSRVLSVGWHQMTGVLDAAAMTVALYVDGTLIGSAATTKLPTDLGATTQNWLGRSMFSTDPYLDGMLDEVRIYNRALTAGEIGYLAGDR